MDEHELFYLAGLFDGEGSFSIQVQIREYKGRKNVRFNYRMTLSLKYGAKPIMDLLIKNFGGQIYEYNGKEGNMFRWNQSSRGSILRTCEYLIPRLRIKKVIGEKFVQALKIIPESRASHRTGQRSWTKEMVREVATIALTLNPTRKSNKDLTYLSELDKVFIEG
ncbi:MAG: LAGLIDADG family homing endonuclease [Candidatus Levyibacteriota bacterium]